LYLEVKEMNTYSPLGTFSFHDVEVDPRKFRPKRELDPEVGINDDC
jgi:hypothetical protein